MAKSTKGKLPLNTIPNIVYIASRTQKNVKLGKNIRVDEDGFENFSDYFTSPNNSDETGSFISRSYRNDHKASSTLVRNNQQRVSVASMSPFTPAGDTSPDGDPISGDGDGVTQANPAGSLEVTDSNSSIDKIGDPPPDVLKEGLAAAAERKTRRRSKRTRTDEESDNNSCDSEPGMRLPPASTNHETHTVNPAHSKSMEKSAARKSDRVYNTRRSFNANPVQSNTDDLSNACSTQLTVNNVQNGSNKADDNLEEMKRLANSTRAFLSKKSTKQSNDGLTAVRLAEQPGQQQQLCQQLFKQQLGQQPGQQQQTSGQQQQQQGQLQQQTSGQQQQGQLQQQTSGQQQQGQLQQQTSGQQQQQQQGQLQQQTSGQQQQLSVQQQPINGRIDIGGDVYGTIIRLPAPENNSPGNYAGTRKRLTYSTATSSEGSTEAKQSSLVADIESSVENGLDIKTNTVQPTSRISENKSTRKNAKSIPPTNEILAVLKAMHVTGQNNNGKETTTTTTTTTVSSNTVVDNAARTSKAEGNRQENLKLRATESVSVQSVSSENIDGRVIMTDCRAGSESESDEETFKEQNQDYDNAVISLLDYNDSDDDVVDDDDNDLEAAPVKSSDNIVIKSGRVTSESLTVTGRDLATAEVYPEEKSAVVQKSSVNEVGKRALSEITNKSTKYVREITNKSTKDVRQGKSSAPLHDLNHSVRGSVVNTGKIESTVLGKTRHERVTTERLESNEVRKSKKQQEVNAVSKTNSVRSVSSVNQDVAKSADSSASNINPVISKTISSVTNSNPVISKAASSVINVSKTISSVTSIKQPCNDLSRIGSTVAKSTVVTSTGTASGTAGTSGTSGMVGSKTSKSSIASKPSQPCSSHTISPDYTSVLSSQNRQFTTGPPRFDLEEGGVTHEGLGSMIEEEEDDDFEIVDVKSLVAAASFKSSQAVKKNGGNVSTESRGKPGKNSITMKSPVKHKEQLEIVRPQRRAGRFYSSESNHSDTEDKSCAVVTRNNSKVAKDVTNNETRRVKSSREIAKDVGKGVNKAATSSQNSASEDVYEFESDVEQSVRVTRSTEDRANSKGLTDKCTDDESSEEEEGRNEGVRVTKAKGRRVDRKTKKPTRNQARGKKNVRKTREDDEYETLAEHTLLASECTVEGSIARETERRTGKKLCDVNDDDTSRMDVKRAKSDKCKKIELCNEVKTNMTVKGKQNEKKKEDTGGMATRRPLRGYTDSEVEPSDVEEQQEDVRKGGVIAPKQTNARRGDKTAASEADNMKIDSSARENIGNVVKMNAGKENNVKGVKATRKVSSSESEQQMAQSSGASQTRGVNKRTIPDDDQRQSDDLHESALINVSAIQPIPGRTRTSSTPLPKRSGVRRTTRQTEKRDEERENRMKSTELQLTANNHSHEAAEEDNNRSAASQPVKKRKSVTYLQPIAQEHSADYCSDQGVVTPPPSVTKDDSSQAAHRPSATGATRARARDDSILSNTSSAKARAKPRHTARKPSATGSRARAKSPQPSISQVSTGSTARKKKLKHDQKYKDKIFKPGGGEDDEGEGVRRSKRTRVAPLDWFKCERIKYTMTDSGGLIVEGIQSPINDTIIKKKPSDGVQQKKNNNKKKKKVARRTEDFRNLSTHARDVDVNMSHSDDENSGSEGSSQAGEGSPGPSPGGEGGPGPSQGRKNLVHVDPRIQAGISVMNPEGTERILIDCIRSHDQFEFYDCSTNQPVTGSERFALCKPLSQNYFSSGVFVMSGLEVKEKQRVRNDTLIFKVDYGKVEVTIDHTTCVLETGDKFFIPPGNSYSLRNLRNDRAKLDFVQIKQQQQQLSSLSSQ